MFLLFLMFLSFFTWRLYSLKHTLDWQLQTCLRWRHFAFTRWSSCCRISATSPLASFGTEYNRERGSGPTWSQVCLHWWSKVVRFQARSVHILLLSLFLSLLSLSFSCVCDVWSTNAINNNNCAVLAQAGYQSDFHGGVLVTCGGNIALRRVSFFFFHSIPHTFPVISRILSLPPSPSLSLALLLSWLHILFVLLRNTHSLTCSLSLLWAERSRRPFSNTNWRCPITGLLQDSWLALLAICCILKNQTQNIFTIIIIINLWFCQMPVAFCLPLWFVGFPQKVVTISNTKRNCSNIDNSNNGGRKQA